MAPMSPRQASRSTPPTRQIFNTEQGSTCGQLHYRILRRDVGPTGGNRDQVITFLVEVHPVLSPGMQVGDDLELLTGPRVKGMGDLETSAQFVRISRS